VRLRDDDDGASPLVVIATFVLGAILVTAVTYALFFDRPEPRLQVVLDQGGDAPAFTVSEAGGGLGWDEVTLRFLDRAGTDHAADFLHEPGGAVDEGDKVTVDPKPPSGTYLLVVLEDGHELSRLVVEL
jgi:hypothetical protein